MNNLQILNTSEYHTDDVIAIVKEFAGSDFAKWSEIKIRHMIKPKTDWRRGQPNRWAKVISAYRSEYLEIGLLKPDRLGDNVLDRIAFHDDEFANAKVANDLAYAIKKLVNYGSAPRNLATTQKIRIVEVSTDDKDIVTYKNLEKKTEQFSAKLKRGRSALKKAKRQVEQLSKSIPRQEKALKDMEDKLRTQRIELRSRGLL